MSPKVPDYYQGAPDIQLIIYINNNLIYNMDMEETQMILPDHLNSFERLRVFVLRLCNLPRALVFFVIVDAKLS